ncbi:MAG TPA: cellulase family glycosylhydrolase [Spirochaetia bacterium]|nr:cellulase family glycosylhydrolase [Spirochaetia bacterium]
MIHIGDGSFRDDDGRALMLRGVNVAGSSKVPRSPNGATHLREGFLDHRHVSFVGRPFPLAEAEEHLARLSGWGLTVLRLVVTWEAIEHAGPGIYDEEYLDYLRDLVTLADRHGLAVLIDPHQDMWSRFSGGDGAPGWTLEAIGFDLEALDETGAAFTHQARGDPLPAMIWASNSGKLAASTMFTLFLGGTDFAPKTRVNNEPVQEYLQRHYVQAIMTLVRRLKGVKGVLGYEAMNEPMPGYIGWKDLRRPGGLITVGDCPSPFQGMALGAGIPQSVDVWRLGSLSLVKSAERLLNPSRRSAWKSGFDCPWRENGVWRASPDGHPELLRPDHFTQVDGKTVGFNDYWEPFVRRFGAALRVTDPDAKLFIEGSPGQPSPSLEAASGQAVAFAPHWYDDLLLAKKRYLSFLGLDSRTRTVVLGRRAVRRCFADQLASYKRHGSEWGVPSLLGEFGIPFDLNGARAYRTGSFAVQARAMDRSFRAVEDNLLSCTLWNYTPDNTNARGDLWNGEDFSIYSRDQKTDTAPDAGGRALEAVVRPYPRATAGKPLRLRFEPRRRRFFFEFRGHSVSELPTEIFVPRLQYPSGYRVSVSDGDYLVVPDRQALLYTPGGGRSTHWIRILPKR